MFDTWFTSSLTPQIGSGWLVDPQRHQRLFPADLRPQSHEIIRTWAFYTIAKALLHERSIPWRHVAVSGWILDPDRKKMSKSRGNVVTPIHLIDSYTADGVRYWAASARLGIDTAFDEKVLQVGRRLVTKLCNAGKFVLAQGPAREAAITAELDRAFLHQLGAVVTEASRAFERFEYAAALSVTEDFFWHWFADTYLELVKGRLRSGETASRSSAVASLRLGLGVLLRLFAPVVPFVTEEIWSLGFAADRAQPSIHRAPWPDRRELAHVDPPADGDLLALAAEALSAVNKSKTASGASVGRHITNLTLAAHPATLTRLRPAEAEVFQAARSQAQLLVERPDLPLGTFQVLRCDLALPA